MRRAWSRLSPRHQEAIALTAWDDLTSDQAGHVLGISATAYRARLARARSALRSHLEDSDCTTTHTSLTRLERSLP
ncbi:sigma factor-like helix-turn-helix DNA-binding protein [Ornithinimicrobium sp. Y1694]|uniref:sigma factor-like helix-turn-helix DNA-binding protein n=1 Tax=Ornithinimicrobium sp. Y1694 TaxID=3418590 RepID=UPI003CF465F0